MSAFNLDEYIMHHVLNSREWHPPFVCAIHLPPPVSLHGLMLVLDAIFLIIIFCLVYQKDHRQAPTGFTNLLEIFVVFIRDEIAIRFLGAKEISSTRTRCRQNFWSRRVWEHSTNCYKKAEWI